MLEATFMQAAVAAVATVLLLWVSLPVAHRFGMVDTPIGRKDHLAPTPTTGGISIVGGVLVAAALLGTPSPAFAALLVAAALLVVVGTLDDAHDVRWYWRILAQVVAALILIYGGGVRVEYVGQFFASEPLQLGFWAVPFTILGTVGVINAINMCDGVDGLAGLLCGVALAMLAVAAVYAGNFSLLEELVPIVGAIGAFLVLNIRSPWLTHAKAFLGNSGSAVLGLVIAWAAFRLTQNGAHPVSPALAPWLLAPPLIDCLVLAARRLKHGRSPFHADRNHLHHMLLDAGFTPTRVAVSLASVSCLLGLSAALVLATNVGTEVHLVVGFAFLTMAYFWLTSDRDRAVVELRSVAHLLGGRPMQIRCGTLIEPELPAGPVIEVVSERCERLRGVTTLRTGGKAAEPHAHTPASPGSPRAKDTRFAESETERCGARAVNSRLPPRLDCR